PVGTWPPRRSRWRTNWTEDPSPPRTSRMRLIWSRRTVAKSCEPISRTRPLPPPSGRLVLHRATVALDVGRALLAGAPLAAVGGEARDGGAGPCGGGLARLRVEAGGKIELVGQARAEELEVVGADARLIHPQAHALVADELGGTDRLVTRCGLGA